MHLLPGLGPLICCLSTMSSRPADSSEGEKKEETVSVKKTQRRVQGVLQRTQVIPLKEEAPVMVVEDHGDIEVRGVGPDHLEEMEQWDLWGLLGQGDSQGEMDCPPLGAHLLPRDWECPLYSMLT